MIGSARCRRKRRWRCRARSRGLWLLFMVAAARPQIVGAGKW